MTQGEWNLIKAVSSIPEVQESWALKMRLPGNAVLEFDIKADTHMNLFTVIHVSGRQLQYKLDDMIKTSMKMILSQKETFN